MSGHTRGDAGNEGERTLFSPPPESKHLEVFRIGEALPEKHSQRNGMRAAMGVENGAFSSTACS